MFDIGFGEMLLLAAIALIALGPKQLPEVARTFGRFMNQVKRITGEFQRTLAEASETTNRHLDEARKTLEMPIVPPNYLGGQAGAPQSTADAQAQGAAPSHEPDPQASFSLGDPHGGGRHGVDAAPAAEGDEHMQMSFDIDKKES